MSNIKMQFLIIVFLTGFADCVTWQSLHAQENNAEIVWDNYGVPHIYAQNEKDIYYALGWAQMKNHADLILKLYAQARGKAAEYWGEEFLPTDRIIHLFEIPEKAKVLYQKQTDEIKEILNSFARGMNDWASENSGLIDPKYKPVLPVETNDVLMHTLRVIYLEFIAGEDLFSSIKLADAGSNAIAIAPSKSASKNAMLIINPHLPWHDYFIWFESHLNCPDINLYGVELVGTPSISQGFNQNLGWAHTVNPVDISDRYELKLEGNKYLFDGKYYDFDKKTVALKIKQKDGTVSEQNQEFWYSKHGPVITRNAKKAYAVRIAGLDNTGIIEQYLRMGKAKNFQEFEKAVKMMQVPMFNIIYADKGGNIFYLFNGNVPVRNEGDFAFWKGTIDGSKSKYLWNKTHNYQDLPKLLNPATGFIQNCNDAPWSCTYPYVLKPSGYPAYMSSRSLTLRPQHAINMIKDNKSVSFEQLIEYKHNTEMESACRFLDDLLQAVNTYGDSTAIAAAKVLQQWDKKTETDSKGAVLFAAWWDKIQGNMFKTPWNIENPVGTPDGLNDEKQAAELLSAAAGEILTKYASLDIAWGDVHKFTDGKSIYAANGGPGDHYGIFRTIYYTDIPGNKKVAVAGETFIAVLEFGEKLKAMVSLSYGNATQPGNKHKGDQLKDLSEKILRPALLEKQEVLKELEQVETLHSVF